MNSSLLSRADVATPTPASRPRRLRRWLRLVLGTAALVGIAALAVFASTDWGATLGAAPAGARLNRMLESPNFRNGRFVNASPSPTPPSGDQGAALWEFFRGNPNRRPHAPLPSVESTAALRALAAAPASGLRVTWLGHSTLLLEIDGQRWLTDPMFSGRASPSPWFGSRRFQPPPLRPEELPPLDGVLLSHDHYDHLDRPSILALNRHGARFFAPLGVGAHLERWGVPADRITEFDWWERRPVGALTLVATPAHHFSGRHFLDRDRTLWAGWALLGPRHRVFFSGDSGQSPLFAEIATALGPFDLACLDVGAWDQTWADLHLGPAGALQAFAALRAQHLLPIHWGTFDLALHPWHEPVDTLLAAPAAPRFLLTPLLGEPVGPAAAPAPTAWWNPAPMKIE